MVDDQLGSRFGLHICDPFKNKPATPALETTTRVSSQRHSLFLAMSDEAVPSRSYVVKQGGFTDPIVDAVMNLGRATVSRY